MKPIPFPRWLQPKPDSIVAYEQQLGRSGWLPFVHLVWSVWVFTTPMFSTGEFGYTWRWLGLTLVSYPLFLWLYAYSSCAQERQAQLAASAMVVLCLVLLPWYPSGLSYFIFGCVMLQPRGKTRLREYFFLLVACNLALFLCAWMLGYPWVSIVWMPGITVVIGMIVAAERSSRRHDAALKLSHEEVRRLAALAERERIGRDLHDLLGHTLSMVAIKADLAGRLLSRDTEAARVEIAEVGKVARQALAQVRGAVSGIRAAGIAAELASAKLLLESDGVTFDYRIDGALSVNALPQGVEHVLAMVVREAATNVQRHAKAGKASVWFGVEACEAVLRIEDDGRGGVIAPGNGLDGMRERIGKVRGRLQIESTSGCGTRVEVRIPLGQEGAEVMP